MQAGNYLELAGFTNHLNASDGRSLGLSLACYRESGGCWIGITPLDAMAIDTKMDDGLPLTGVVGPLDPFAFSPGDPGANDGDCAVAVAGDNLYNAQNPYHVCILLMKLP